ERREFEKRRTGIDKALDTFARQKLAAIRMTLARAFVAAERCDAHTRFQFVYQRVHCSSILFERSAARCNGRFENSHRRSTATAVASPPPMHSEAIPRLRPRFSSALSSVTRMRAPDAPMG